ncbi:hypothetical protein OSB04_000195 [Centaurea solstitialis]|uniref:U5 small nuclear ribonucleoprotein TSSC4 n=1 Tax=Centaurea solstitialis TaxID=347529 RepID=A0AA38WTQ0_9ASTR|nr:hypothetical protein OSB04_000195 [Centaurea solstitialis]
MEDSFKVRVDRAFGSLEAATASSSIKSTTSSSLWCLTDQEIERNEWIQLHKEKDPKPSSSSSFFHPPDLQSDIKDEDQQPLEDRSNDEWNVLRSSIGVDCTLDNEEEEDAFDKVALGEEERFYMKEANDYEVEIDSNNELPSSFTEAFRDPRANLMAAKLRIKEDDESVAAAAADIPIQKEEEDGVVVPDYVRNPSKYTHYTFDSMDDLDEESNKKAYMELLNSVKAREDESMDDDVSSTSIVFTPRNKSSDDGSINKSKVNLQKKKVVPMISIAAESEEVCVMEEDEPEMASNKTTGGRKYRTKNVE